MFELNHVGCRYNESFLFEPLSVTFKTQERILIQGLNGVGKTTLLRTMLGLHPCACGSLTFDGVSIQDYQRYQLGQVIGYVHQQPSFQLFGMSVWEECTLFAKWRKQMIDEHKINTVLKSLNLDHLKDQHPQLCSRGEQQRLSIAIALLQEPRFMILDEPTTALDDNNVDGLINIIQQRADLGWIIVSHDQRLSKLHFDNVITLQKVNCDENT